MRKLKYRMVKWLGQAHTHWWWDTKWVQGRSSPLFDLSGISKRLNWEPLTYFLRGILGMERWRHRIKLQAYVKTSLESVIFFFGSFSSVRPLFDSFPMTTLATHELLAPNKQHAVRGSHPSGVVECEERKPREARVSLIWWNKQFYPAVIRESNKEGTGKVLGGRGKGFLHFSTEESSLESPRHVFRLSQSPAWLKAGRERWERTVSEGSWCARNQREWPFGSG